MLDFSEQERMMHFPLFCGLHASQGQPRGARARIEFEGEGLEDTCFLASILEPDDKRSHSMHDRPPS